MMGPPKKRKAAKEAEDSEESEWEQEGGGGDDDDDDDDVQDSASASQASASASQASTSQASGKDDSVSGGNESKVKKVRIRKPRRKYEDEHSEGEEDDCIPSQERLTDKGGYAHTSKSRLRISRANRGNTPWNKGKNRSNDVRAKISAGVRARNRAILLEKLKRLGMTEDEWFAKKKEIKYIRERLRRAKKANAHRQAEEAEMKLQEAIDMTTENGENETMKTEETAEEAAEAAVVKKAEARKVDAIKAKIRRAEAKEAKAKANEDTGANQKAEAEEVKEAEEVDEDADVEEEEEAEEEFPTSHLFAKDFRDFNWTPHSYDSKELSFAAACPRGGPGGMICCESCTAQYSDYLSGTTGDIEQQKAAKMGGEMTELLGFLSSAKKILGQSVRVARRKPVPMPRVNLKSIAALVDPSSQPTPDLEELNGEDVEDVPELKSVDALVDPSSQTSADNMEDLNDVEDIAEV
jgi:hypothetical protein